MLFLIPLMVVVVLGTLFLLTVSVGAVIAVFGADAILRRQGR